MIQVLVVEDSRITRDAIESQIAKSEKYVLYASIENAANAEIACLRRACRFDSNGCLYG